MARKRRQRLKAHDMGLDRHNKGLSWMRKQDRKAHERAALNQKRKRS